MKVTFIVIIYLIFNTIFAKNSNEFTKKWKFVRDNKSLVIWKSNDSNGIYASISFKDKEKSSDFKLLKKKIF